MHTTHLESNIWKYAVNLITKKRAYMTILGVYLLTLPDATAKTVGLMSLVGSLTGFIFEIPSGYIADKLGHKKALVLSRIGLLISSSLFFIGNEVYIFLLGSAFLSIGLAFHSGTGSVFMHDTLKALGREAEYSKIMGRISSIGFAVPIALIVAIPFLVSVSFRAAFAVAVIIDIVGLLVAISFVVPDKAEAEIKEIDVGNFRKAVKDGLRFGFFRYAIFTGIIAGMIGGSSSFKDVYQALLGVPIIYFGVFWGISRVLVSSLLLLNDKVKNVITFHQFLFAKLVVSLSLIMALGVFTHPWLIVTVFILNSSFNWSFMETQQHFMLEIISNSRFKATLLSIKALLSALTMGSIAYFIGLLAHKTSFNNAFITLSIVGASTLVPLYLYILFAKKKSAPAQQ